MKKVILFAIPVSICNFRCHYCYLGQREESFQGIHPEMKYSPEHFAKAMSVSRIGGLAYGNFTADGETLLVKNIDLYVKAFLEQGHYAEVVTNLTVTKGLEKFLLWDKELLKHLEFKCSFHYLELKKRGLLETFAENVNKIWEAGASANIEITPNDELIPYIEEVKEFSLKHFGALPHISIARDDRVSSIDYLTNLPKAEYDQIWSQFESDFWKFKKTIFGKKQEDFCYAGRWSVFVNLCSGEASACYGHKPLGNVLEDPQKPFPEKAIGECPVAHCYNGHMLLTLGLIPGAANVKYGDIRDRTKTDGSHWLQPELKNFFNTTVEASNKPFGRFKKKAYIISQNCKSKKNISVLLKQTLRDALGQEKYENLKKYVKKDN